MNVLRRQTIIDMYEHAVRQTAPWTVVPAHLRVTNGSLYVAGQRVEIPPEGVFVIALGKASVPMMAAAEEALGSAMQAGVVVTKHIDDTTVRATVYQGAHPVPDERSLAAGAALMEFARDIPQGAVVICLISGGGSSLAESLREGVQLEKLQDVTSTLLRAGATIHELNAVRARLSAFKAGGLLHALRHTLVFNLIISDVLGNDLSVIASGPTIAPDGSLSAEEVLERYGLSIAMPRARTLTFPEAQSTIMASVTTAVDAAASQAVRAGYHACRLGDRFEGEGRWVAATLADVALAAAGGRSDLQRPLCLLAGGETTVTVAGDGVGGRNTESALSAALRVAGADRITIGCLATDGDDGVSGVAGGIVDGATIPIERRNAALAALNANDSYTFLEAAGATWGSGPTGTNVNDLFIALVDV